MSKHSNFMAYVVGDLLAPLKGVTTRAMFGGWGIYKDGDFFALIADDELYLKVDDTNKAQFVSIGSHPFQYSSKGKKAVTMSYWVVPKDILENQEHLLLLVESAVAVARNAKVKK